MTKLEEIGFYTLSNDRAIQVAPSSPMWRCEMVLTNRCNFKCPYCRGLKGELSQDMPLAQAETCLDLWIKDGLKNIRFSGGEPTLYPALNQLIKKATKGNVERIAISTNGSMNQDVYDQLLKDGVNDFSISLDACCTTYGDRMAGVKGKWDKVVKNIRWLASQVYTTVGIVLTEDNLTEIEKIIIFAHELGVADIRIIPAAQYDQKLTNNLKIPDDVLNTHPILKYRIQNIKKQKIVRGLCEKDCDKCSLVVDDSVAAGKWHFPCVIYLREGGKPIGKINPNMRKERINWAKNHNTKTDPICKLNCLDVCIDYNNFVNNHATF